MVLRVKVAASEPASSIGAYRHKARVGEFGAGAALRQTQGRTLGVVHGADAIERGSTANLGKGCVVSCGHCAHPLCQHLVRLDLN
jgi:hypothetical protein